MAATTTKMADFLGRSLVNDLPGTSNATDFLGRLATGTDKDFLGRSLGNTPLFPPPDRANTTAYTAGQRVKQKGTDEVQTLTVTGTANFFKLDVDMRGSVQRTANIAFNANAAAITAAIVALPNVEPGDVVVSGTSPFNVLIQSERGNTGQIAVAPGSPDLTGGTATTGTTTQGIFAGEILEATTTGTTGGSVPTTPAIGATVVDGTVTWRRLR